MTRAGVLLLGAGFIGGALARALAASGRQVHLVSRNPGAVAGAGISCHHSDLGNPSLLRELLPQCGAIVHTATVSTPGSSAGQPLQELDNLLPTLRLVDTLRTCERTHLIYLSSGGTVYGNPAQNPVSENAPLTPLSFYGAGKVAAEGFVRALRGAGHPVTILRPSNAYGPGQNLQKGFGLIRTVLQHIRNGTALDLWGDGMNVRDFVYVDDVVNAILRCVDAPADSDTYNVGSGSGHSVKDVVEVAQRVSGTPLQVNFHPARNVDVREVVLNNERIQAALGWKPSTGLEEGMRSTWQWLQRNGEA